jgi:acetyltransferase-like isoleucine patch superfamily enzyme
MTSELMDEREYRKNRGLPAWRAHARKPLSLISRFWFGWHWRVRALRWMGVNIEGAYIGRDCIFDEEVPELITVEPKVTMSMRVSVIAHDSFRHVVGRVRICRHAFVGVGAIILPGVTIGEGAVVAAGAVVNKSVEPYTMVGGVPAVFIRRVNPAEHGLSLPPGD